MGSVTVTDEEGITLSENQYREERVEESAQSVASGKYSTISEIVQLRILQSESSVFVETDSPDFKRRIVELLIPPFTWSL